MTLGSAFQNAGRPRFFKYTSRCKLVLAVLRFNAKFRALSQCSAPGASKRTGVFHLGRDKPAMTDFAGEGIFAGIGN